MHQDVIAGWWPTAEGSMLLVSSSSASCSDAKPPALSHAPVLQAQGASKGCPADAIFM